MEKTKRKRIISPWQSGALFYLGFFLSTGSFSPFLYVHYSELGITGQQVGLLATFFPLATVFLAAPLSSLADRRQWRIPMLQIGILAVAAIFFFMQFQDSFLGVALLMLPMAIFFSPVMSIADSLIARMAQRWELNYGAMRLWGSIGFASAAFIFGAIWERVGFKPMFVVGALILVPLVWVTGQLEDGKPQSTEERISAKVIFRDKGLLLLLISTFLAGIANSLSMTFEGIYVRSLGGTSFLIGMMTAFAAFSELPTMFFGQKIGEKLKGANAIILAYALSSVAYLGFLFVPNPDIMPVFSVFKGLGYGLFFTNAVRIITERAPEEWSSTAQSFMAIGLFGLAPLLAGPLGGTIHDYINPAAVFGLGALALICAGTVLSLGAIRGLFR